MPWREASAMSLRLEFVTLASHEDANMRALCRRFGISPNTAYKWLARYRAAGRQGWRSAPAGRDAVPARPARPWSSWCWRRARRIRPGVAARSRPTWSRPGYADVPAASHHHGHSAPARVSSMRRRPLKHRAWQRFERAAPNELWQMDFKGHFALGDGARCHPLTVLDDHSALLCWRCTPVPTRPGPPCRRSLTGRLRALRLARAHPVRSWAALGCAAGRRRVHDAEVLAPAAGRRPRARPALASADARQGRALASHLAGRAAAPTDRSPTWPPASPPSMPGARCIMSSARMRRWRLQVPATCYRPSPRPWPGRLPAIEYPPSDRVRRVQDKGQIKVGGHEFRIGKAFIGYPVGSAAHEPGRLL